ncbi:MAG: glycosyltransferase [Bacteroidales bacterium]|nr:glycosyltransferase [Bacteroidales bacterium]
MQIWAHTLVKDEEKWLWYSVSSIVNYVDKLLLWDTGSKDGSIEIEKELQKKYPGKIEIQQKKQETGEEFTHMRQEMLDSTKADWFLMLDGDEIWWKDSIKKVVETIRCNDDCGIESIVVPTVNLVGDVFHYQERNAGKYRFGNMVGHYNLRAIRTNVPGLHSQGVHGVWGWADCDNKMIQDRDSYKYVDAPYMHTTNLERSKDDKFVIKRNKKYRHEIGDTFPLDYFYPEVFFEDKPENVYCPWRNMSPGFFARSFFETPLRKIKRRFFVSSVGY